MTLQFEYTFEDYREAFTGQAQEDKPRRWLGSILSSTTAAVIVVLLFGLLNLKAGESDDEAPPAALAWRLAAAVVPSTLLFMAIAVLTIRQALRGPPKPWETLPSGTIAAQRAKAKKTSTGLFGWVLFIGLAIVLFTLLQSKTPQVGATTAPARSGSVTMLDFFPGVVPWVLIFLLMFILTRISRGRGLRANWEAQPALHGPYSVEVMENGITFASPLSRQAYSWAYFAGFKETPNLLLLYPSPFAFHIFPKRAFPSPDAIDYFRGLLLTHVKNGHFLEQPSAFPVVPLAAKAAEG